MAKVRKRTLPSGELRWLADYVDSKGRRRAKQFAKRKDADAYLVKVRGDLQRGVHVAPGASITVAEAGELWIERAERDKLVTSTIRQYRQHLAHHIGPDLGKAKLSDLTAPQVNSFADKMLEDRSRALTRKVLTSLGSLVDEAVRRGLAAHNPVRGVKIKVVHEERDEGDEIEMPSKDELRAIIRTAAGRWRPIIITAAFTGMRASELRGLKWEDVDLKDGVIHVRRRVDAWGSFGAPKSKAGKRDIPLAPIVANTLKEWRLACPKGDKNPLDLVFPSPSGGILAHACILKDGFGPLQIAAGIVRLVDAAGPPEDRRSEVWTPRPSPCGREPMDRTRPIAKAHSATGRPFFHPADVRCVWKVVPFRRGRSGRHGANRGAASHLSATRLQHFRPKPLINLARYATANPCTSVRFRARPPPKLRAASICWCLLFS
jgi:integrase